MGHSRFFNIRLISERCLSIFSLLDFIYQFYHFFDIFSPILVRFVFAKTMPSSIELVLPVFESPIALSIRFLSKGLHGSDRWYFFKPQLLPFSASSPFADSSIITNMVIIDFLNPVCLFYKSLPSLVPVLKLGVNRPLSVLVLFLRCILCECRVYSLRVLRGHTHKTKLVTKSLEGRACALCDFIVIYHTHRPLSCRLPSLFCMCVCLCVSFRFKTRELDLSV